MEVKRIKVTKKTRSLISISGKVYSIFKKLLQKLFIARKSTVVYGNSNQPSQGDTCRR